MTDVVVVGAGPYGLSVSAHLRGRGLRVRTFGRAMDTWSARMPAGMLLKSEGFASSLSDPGGRFTLARFCDENGRPYADLGRPVERETFIDYGRWFAEHAVGEVEDSTVSAVTRRNGRFAVEHEHGTVEARSVVVATGVPHFAYVPPQLLDLPASLRSHSADHDSLAGFAGKDVAVVGGGQSALEAAALIHEAGGRPRVLVRKPRVLWNGRPPELPQPLLQRLRWPISPLGTGLRLWGFSHLAPAYRFLAPQTRDRVAWETLGPAGSWWLRDRIGDAVPLLTGHRVVGATADGNRVRLRLEAAGEESEASVDHVLAATGYRVDLGRLAFLPAELRERIEVRHGSPQLSRAFESTVPGLSFVGMAAAHSFGPLMRFVCGAELAARRVAARAARA